jgi:TetR/AcrR family transcriptional repressor of nem operon
MPRPRLFSIDEILARAQLQFQRDGYHATSTQVIVDCTGAGRGSIYNTFDSKRDLYIRALRRYIETRHQRLQARANDLSSSRAAILSVFECTIEECPDGCFIVNTSVELSSHDSEIAQLVSAALYETEQLFRRLVDRGQATGEIAATVDPALTAGGLLGLYLGLCVLIRSGSGAAALRDLLRQAATLLR